MSDKDLNVTVVLMLFLHYILLNVYCVNGATVMSPTLPYVFVLYLTAL